jgi:hypothetical protein
MNSIRIAKNKLIDAVISSNTRYNCINRKSILVTLCELNLEASVLTCLVHGIVTTVRWD